MSRGVVDPSGKATTPPQLPGAAAGTSPRHARRAWLRYRIDSTFSSGTAPLIAWLALITLAMVLLAGTTIAILHASVSGTGDRSFREAVWASLLRTLDPGTMGDDVGWEFRTVSLLVTVGGIFVVSTLIGLIASGLDRKLDALRQGRAPVVEYGHTLVLGWSHKLPALIAELVVANENRRDACVVVLAPRDKASMERELRARLGSTKPTRVVCRTGDPSDPIDIGIASPSTARSIVVLAPDGEAGDASVVRAVLSLMSRGMDFISPPVVAEFRHARSARALRGVLDRRLVTVVSDEVIGRLAAQVSRQRGLGSVYEELLDFAGDEIYFTDATALHGRCFGEAVLSCERSSVIGLQQASGAVVLAPPMSTPIAAGDRIIAISRDNDAVVFDRVAEASTMPMACTLAEDAGTPEHVLILGWSSLGPLILRELDRSAGHELRVHVVQRGKSESLEDEPEQFRNLVLSIDDVDRDDPGDLRRLLEADLPDHVLLLCTRDGATPAQADADTLLRLLQLQQALDHAAPNADYPSIVVELLEARDVELAAMTRADDFILSDLLTSLMLAQLAENASLDLVLRDLLDVDGTEIRMRAVRTYGLTPGDCPYVDLVRAGIGYEEVVIGYRHHRRRSDHSEMAILLNPPKDSVVTLSGDDELVVLTQHTR